MLVVLKPFLSFKINASCQLQELIAGAQRSSWRFIFTIKRKPQLEASKPNISRCLTSELKLIRSWEIK